MRADLVALGARLGWVDANEEEKPALDAVHERLQQEGEGLLLIYDNAIDAASLRPYLPVGGAARVLVTSNRMSGGELPPLSKSAYGRAKSALTTSSPARVANVSAPRRKHCRKSSAACRSRTNRPLPIASVWKFHLTNI